MKKILAIAVLFAAMVFTGCSKNDDVSISGATSYSGPLVGTWESIIGGVTNTMTFNSDGTYIWNSAFAANGDPNYWEAESGNFYVQDEYIALLMTKAGSSDDGWISAPEEYRWISFFYIDSVNDTTLSMGSIEAYIDGSNVVDFSVAETAIEKGNYNSPDTYTKID